ncbi:MAG: hypothetical protein PHX09_02205 [Clostridia bacterium]|nr:hypothetical protein [Clostridia bacterium]MDD4686106.1 hypothetical protein [Clostridia bacterium]
MGNKRKLYSKLLSLTNLFKLESEKDNVDLIINSKFLPSWITTNPSFEGVEKVLNSGHPCGWQKTKFGENDIVYSGKGYIKCKPEIAMPEENYLNENVEDSLASYNFTIQASKKTGEVLLANFKFDILDEDLDMALCSYPKNILFEKFNKPKTAQLIDKMLDENTNYILDVNQIIRVTTYDSVYCEYDLLSYNNDNRVSVKIDKAYVLYYDNKGRFFSPFEDDYTSFEIIGQMKTPAAEVAENTLKIWGVDTLFTQTQKQKPQYSQEYETMFQ